MRKVSIILINLFMTLSAQAQWCIRESELAGSKLEAVYKETPYLVQVIPDSVWDHSNFASDADMQWYREARYGMYIHFGLSTYVNADLSWGVAEAVAPDRNKGRYPRNEWTSWPRKLRLEKFSAEELAKILRQSGMKYVVVVTKHHDGFHLFDTKYSNFNIMHTPYGKDFVREVVNACHMAGVKVGFYFSQRDWYHPDYEPIDTTAIEPIKDAPYYKMKPGQKRHCGTNHQRYIKYMFDVVRELCTNYGKIDMFNFDAVCWNNMFTADMWDAERLTRMIRQLQPGIIINNRASLPGDYDSPEQRMGMYQDNRMWETCMCLCDTWSYSPTRVKTAQEIFSDLQSAAMGNGNLLVSWGMKWDGSWDTQQENTLLAVGRLLKKYGQSIYRTHGGPWLPQAWGGSTFNKDLIYLHVLHPQGSISLPKLQGLEIRLQNVLTGQRVRFSDKGNHYEISDMINTFINRPFIIVLKASRPLTQADILRKD